jgi:hypothetical protein
MPSGFAGDSRGDSSLESLAAPADMRWETPASQDSRHTESRDSELARPIECVDMWVGAEGVRSA